jgi:hypothetical protein
MLTSSVDTEPVVGGDAAGMGGGGVAAGATTVLLAGAFAPCETVLPADDAGWLTAAFLGPFATATAGFRGAAAVAFFLGLLFWGLLFWGLLFWGPAFDAFLLALLAVFFAALLEAFLGAFFAGFFAVFPVPFEDFVFAFLAFFALFLAAMAPELSRPPATTCNPCRQAGSCTAAGDWICLS